jgi:hypothetical protein
MLQSTQACCKISIFADLAADISAVNKINLLSD